MLEKSEIRFLPLGARRVAYEMRGDGPPLVAPAWWVSHLELDWQNAGFRRFWEGVADGYTLIRYDRLGVGMSDRTVQDSDLTIDGEVATLRALLDELQLDRVSLVGGSCGSCTAIAFAAAFPERVERLVLYGSYPDGAAITAPGVADAILAAVRAHWGLGSRLLSDMFLAGADSAEYDSFARFQRESTSAETAAALLGLVYRLDVRAQLPLVRQPALVVHRRDDRAVPFRLGREVAAAIPGATFIRCRGARTSLGTVMSIPSSARAAKRWHPDSRRRTMRASRSGFCCPVVSVRSSPASRAVSATARSQSSWCLARTPFTVTSRTSAASSVGPRARPLSRRPRVSDSFDVAGRGHSRKMAASLAMRPTVRPLVRSRHDKHHQHRTSGEPTV